jgi:hypothetical protein
MTPARLALATAETRLVARLQKLDAMLADGDETALQSAHVSGPCARALRPSG